MLKNQLSESKQALEDFFDDMLFESEAEAPAEDATTSVAEENIVEENTDEVAEQYGHKELLVDSHEAAQIEFDEIAESPIQSKEPEPEPEPEPVPKPKERKTIPLIAERAVYSATPTASVTDLEKSNDGVKNKISADSGSDDLIRVIKKPLQPQIEEEQQRDASMPAHAEKKSVMLNENILVPKEPIVEKPKLQPKVEIKQEVVPQPVATKEDVVAREEPKIEAPVQPKVAPTVKQPEKKKPKKVEVGFKLSNPLGDDLINGVPNWAHPDFQCLFFNVGVVKLAVPLVKLKGVVPFPEKVARPPKSPDWYLGLFMNRGQHVKIIDTAELILPGGYNGKKEQCEPNKLIFVGDGELGLICSGIGDVVKITESEVRWREGDGGKRPWLLGTVKKHLCALVDTAGVIKLLRQMGIEKD